MDGQTVVSPVISSVVDFISFSFTRLFLCAVCLLMDVIQSSSVTGSARVSATECALNTVLSFSDMVRSCERSTRSDVNLDTLDLDTMWFFLCVLLLVYFQCIVCTSLAKVASLITRQI